MHTSAASKMTRPRGIINVSHTSCHLACALQLLMHGLEPLRDALIEIARQRQGNAFLRQLGSFFRMEHQYESAAGGVGDGVDDDVATIDPSTLYKCVKETVKIDPHDIGDAVTVLRRILQAIRTPSTPCSTSFQDLYNHVLGGIVRQDIIGRKGSVQRVKSKEREIQCPLSIPGQFASVQEGLAHATTKPQPIAGYDWDQLDNSTYVESDLQDNDSDDDSLNTWQTHKTSRFVSLPQHLLLHLQRFVHHMDGSVTSINENTMDIPLTIDMSQYQCEDSSLSHNDYQLRGAILYVQDQENQDDHGDCGHFVSVHCMMGQEDNWYLVDDETVTLIPTDDILNFISGRPSAVEKANSTYTAVLLHYRRSGPDGSNVLLDKLRTELAATPPSEEYSIIGKRLRVQWAKGKWYAGTISGYNDITGKHSVLYDDGDVKEYNLTKKTIEWE
jgi:hypothetical protein